MVDAALLRQAEADRDRYHAAMIEARKERDALQHIIDCANTPLMRSVMAERDRLREALETVSLTSHELEIVELADAALVRS